MSEVIKNRYEFVVLFDVENGNPNGDPDAGNMPRIDPESGLGLVTDVCLKRKIRNYIETVKEEAEGYKIYIKDDVPLNRSDREACASVGVQETDEKKVTESLKKLKKNDENVDIKIWDYMCQNFFDIRTFGAVMTTFVKAALNCGQVRGPVQLGFARSIDPIVSQEVTITRVAITTEKDAYCVCTWKVVFCFGSDTDRSKSGHTGDNPRPILQFSMRNTCICISYFD